MENKTSLIYLVKLQEFSKEVIRIMMNADYLPDERLDRLDDLMDVYSELVKILADRLE